jgi:hypothetical protein
VCYYYSTMSFLFDPRAKTAFKWIWVIIATLIIASMVAGLWVGM